MVDIINDLEDFTRVRCECVAYVAKINGIIEIQKDTKGNPICVCDTGKFVPTN